MEPTNPLDRRAPDRAAAPAPSAPRGPAHGPRENAPRERPENGRKQALDAELDEALKGTFPASDPVSLTQPGSA